MFFSTSSREQGRMESLLLLGTVGFVIALAATAAARDLAIRWRLVDQPDDVRKLHSVPMPRIGGIPIAFAYLAAFAVALAVPVEAGRLIRDGLPAAARLAPAAAVVLATGLIDDLRRLTAKQKLAGQVAAGCLAIASGVQISSLAGYPLHPWLSAPLTLLWLVACTNAFNLIDGVDGLAAGAGLFAAVTVLIAALLHNNMPLAFVTAPLAGALFGFLRYNFSPASIFLGDSGSLLIGFLMGCFGVIWSQKCATVLGLTAPLMALAIPLLDTVLAVARRFVARQPIFGADRGHIHHRLLDRGLTPRRVALLLYMACGLAASLSLLTSVAQERMAGPVLVLFCLITWVGIQHLGYVEFGLASRLFMDGTLRQMVKSQLQLRAIDSAIRNSGTVDEVWTTLRESAAEFGFSSIRFTAAGRRFKEEFRAGEAEQVWSLSIPLRGGAVDLTRSTEDGTHGFALAQFAATVQSAYNSLPGLIESEALEPTDTAGSAIGRR